MQPAGRADAPGGEGGLAHHVEEGERILGDDRAGLFEPSARAGFLQTANGGIGNPQHKLGAGRAAIGLDEAPRRAGDGQREGFALAHQIAHALAQRGLDAARRARLVIGNTVEQGGGRIGIVHRAGPEIGELDQRGQGGRRPVDARRGPAWRFRLGRGFPHQHQAGMGAKHAVGARHTVFQPGHAFLPVGAGSAHAIGQAPGPERGSHGKSDSSAGNDQRRQLYRLGGHHGMPPSMPAHASPTRGQDVSARPVESPV